MFDLKGKVALLTGATAWLGRDMAEAFAEQGCDIILTSRQKEKADQAAAEIAAKYGVEAIGLPLDVNNVASVEALAAAAHGWKGHIDFWSTTRAVVAAPARDTSSTAATRPLKA
jgi:NAD(P)-dependent dehydrogenase (short-subunit alcohol dehydrogenase family)